MTYCVPTTEQVELYFGRGVSEYARASDETAKSLDANPSAFASWLADHDQALRKQIEVEADQCGYTRIQRALKKCDEYLSISWDQGGWMEIEEAHATVARNIATILRGQK